MPSPAQTGPAPVQAPPATNVVAVGADSLPVLDDATNAAVASDAPVQLGQEQVGTTPGNTYWFLLWLLLLLIALAVLRVYLVRRNQAA